MGTWWGTWSAPMGFFGTRTFSSATGTLNATLMVPDETYNSTQRLVYLTAKLTTKNRQFWLTYFQRETQIYNCLIFSKTIWRHSLVRTLTGHSLSWPGCREPQQGFLPAENNVPGYQDIASAGPEDCAKKCGSVKECAAWTLQLE